MRVLRSRAEQALGALRIAARNADIRRVELAWGALVSAEWTHFVALGVFTYGHWGSSAVGVAGLISNRRSSRIAPMAPGPNLTSRGRRTGLRLIAACAGLACAASLAGVAVGHAGTAATAPAATLRDPANDVRAGDIDLTSVSVGKSNGSLVVRFTVRRPITNNVSYTASVRSGGGSWALVARRGGGSDSFMLYNLATGTTTPIGGSFAGRTAAVSAPIDKLGGQTSATLGRVSAYFRAEPVGGRTGDADRAATIGPTAWFCLTDRKPRPKWGPCIWPGQIR